MQLTTFETQGGSASKTKEKAPANSEPLQHRVKAGLCWVGVGQVWGISQFYCGFEAQTLKHGVKHLGTTHGPGSVVDHLPFQ